MPQGMSTLDDSITERGIDDDKICGSASFHLTWCPGNTPSSVYVVGADIYAKIYMKQTAFVPGQ